MRSDMRLSVLVCCYGDFPQYSLRAVRSVLHGFGSGKRPFDLHVGANQCCQETISGLRSLSDAGMIDTVIESRDNLNKDPMMRLLLNCVETQYFMWLDDDSFMLEGWHPLFQEFIDRHHPFDVAGRLLVSFRDEEYLRFLYKRRWFVSAGKFKDILHPKVDNSNEMVSLVQHSLFPLGAAFLARADFLRKHDFPDPEMVKRGDDMLLGDLVAQQNGRLLPYSVAMREHMQENAGDRRGQGEGGDGFACDGEDRQETRVEERQGTKKEEKPRVERIKIVLADNKANTFEPNPPDVVALNNRGNELSNMGRHEEACELYRQAIVHAPKCAELYFNIANVLRKLGRHEEAVRYYHQAIEVRPEYSDALNNLGIALSDLDRIAEAADVYRRAIDADPRNAPACNNLGNALNKLGKKNEAIDAYKKALAIDPNLAVARETLKSLIATECRN